MESCIKELNGFYFLFNFDGHDCDKRGHSRPRVRFQGKGCNVTLVWFDKLGFFLSFALCNEANFDHL